MNPTRPEQRPGPAGIDRTAYEPAYVQIANALAAQIGSGDYRPGSQLPTEAQLRAEFSVSPMTVRRAVGLLIDRGLVTTTQGKGTFVRSLDLSEAVFRLHDLTDAWAADSSVNVRLLEASIIPASARVAAALRRPIADRTVYLRRVLIRDSVPIMYHREHLVYDPRRPLVEAHLRISSLEGLLQSAGSEGLPAADLTIQAVNLGAEAAELLQVPPGSAAFCLEHIFYDFDGQPVSWGWFLCRADQFRLATRIGPGAGGRGHV